MTLDMAHLTGRNSISDLAKYFDVIAQDVHSIVGNHVGLSTTDHLCGLTEGYKYTMPLGALQSRMLPRHLGIPQGTI